MEIFVMTKKARKVLQSIEFEMGNREGFERESIEQWRRTSENLA